jgi:hypothetical protein
MVVLRPARVADVVRRGRGLSPPHQPDVVVSPSGHQAAFVGGSGEPGPPMKAPRMIVTTTPQIKPLSHIAHLSSDSVGV